MAELVVNLKVNDDGTVTIRKFTDEVGGAENATKKFSDSLFSLKGLLGSLGLIATIREIGQMADSWNNLEGRLKLVTTSTRNLVSVQNELFAIAQRSRTSYESTADLYFRLAKSTETLGISQTRLAKVTETISKTLAVSGASAESANAALIQLGQGFASGTLRGEELNSVLEQAPALAEAIAKGMGKTVGELRKLGAEGKLTADAVFGALEKQGQAVEDQFNKMPKTIGQSFTMIGNSLLKFVGEADDATGASTGFASAMMDLSGVLDGATKSLHNWNIEIVRLQDVRKIKTFEDVNTSLQQIDDEIKALTTSNTLYDRTKRALESEQSLKAKLNNLQAARNELNKKAITMAEQDNATQEKLSKTLPKVSQAIDKKSASYKKASDEAQRLRDIESYWSQQSAQGRLSVLSDITKTSQYDMQIAEEQAKNALEFYQVIQSDSERINDKFMAIYEANKDLFNQEDMAKFFTVWNSELDKSVSKSEEATNEVSTFWSDMFSNIKKAMESQFFDAMTGRFESFGSWLKDMWASITQSMARGLSKTLADFAMGGIQNSFKSFGGLGAIFGSASTPSALLGAVTDSAGFTETTGGTVFDAAGQITKQGSDYADVANAINAASTAHTAYQVLTGGLASIGTNIASGFGYLAEGLNALGLTSAGTGVSNFGLGAGSVFTGSEFAGASAMGVGQLLGGAGVGALGGYALGSLGDKLFGANTKAGTYGAIGGGIGGAIGTAILPGVGTAIGAGIGSALGAVIGGMFGSTKVVESGLYFSQNTSADIGINAIQNYVDKKKKSWFSSSSSSNYSGIDEQTKKNINSIFKSYDYLLEQLGNIKKVTLKASRYSAESFKDEIAKSFISNFTGIQQYLNSFLYSRNGFVYTRYRDTPEMERIFSYWSDYAKSVNKTVMEALTTSVGEYISTTRSFEEWKLGKGSKEQLKYTSDYLNKDLNALEKMMGVSGVTVDNFLSMYDKALKKTFTPETISQWNSLGNALISATEAQKAYTDALSASVQVIPKDMMISRSGVATGVSISDMVATQEAGNAQSSQMVAQLYEVIKVLKQQYTLAQFGTTGQGIPA